MKTTSFPFSWVSLILVALAILFPQTIYAAGATSTEINNAIVLEGSVPLTWENDAAHPWVLSDGWLKSEETTQTSFTSTITFEYTSEDVTNISFKFNYPDYSTNTNKFEIYIDGEYRYFGNWRPGSNEYSMRLKKGTHKFSIKVFGRYQFQLWDVKVLAYPGATSAEINNAILMDGSLPLNWEQDENYPWCLTDGKLQSSNWSFAESQSSVSFKYSSQYPTTLKFKYNFIRESSYNYLRVYADGDKILDTYYGKNESVTIRLPKGNHTVEFRDSISKSGSYDLYSQIYDINVIEYPGASIDEINKTIVLDESLPLNWEQDENYPWCLTDGKLQSSNWSFAESQSSVSFKYSSQYPTTLKFKYNFIRESSYNYLRVYADGDKILDTYYGKNESVTIRLPKGNHTVEFRDTISKSTSFNLYSQIYDISIKEPACASDETLNGYFNKTKFPIVWVQDSVFPLGYVNGILQSTNSYWENSSSSLTGKVTLETPSVISFDWRLGYGDNDGYHIAKFYVDGVLKNSNSRNTSWATNTIALPAGEHTLHWEYNNYRTGAKYWMQLRNLSITSDWVSVESSPGMLGVETLYKVNKLQDVNFLKIKGGMNDADWQVVKQMVNLYGLDLSEAEITTFPASFNGNANFGYIVLPETLRQIPNKAFTACNIHSITIPSSVTSIGNEAFASTNLGFIDFADNSQLITIGYKAFYSTKIKEFIMPNSVTKLDTYRYSSDDYRSEAFASCPNLSKIKFSDNLVVLPRYLCAYSNNISEITFPQNLEEIGDGFMEMWVSNNKVLPSTLEAVVLPAKLKRIGDDAFSYVRTLKDVNLPESLESIGSYAFIYSQIENITFPQSLSNIGSSAFRYCPLESVILPGKLRSLGQYAFANNAMVKNVVLPSGITDYDRQFSGCENIRSIECLCATPPAITNDPFSACEKSSVTLKVPQFAVATYKLDLYWYQFDPIIEGEPTDYWKIIGDLKLLNNRRMEGKPDVDLYYGGKLTVKGDAAMPIGKFDIYTSEGNPSAFVTDCANITADEINTIFSVSANKWHFMTPMVDVDLQQVIVSGTTNYVFRYYDGAARADIGAGTSWKNVSDMKLKAGVGYIFQCDKDGTLTFPVPVSLHKNILTTGAVTLPLTPHPSDNKANKGWNYVGNPFPSYFDIHYMDFTAPITVWNGSTYKAYSITDDNFVLRPMQGFFVQKPDAVDNIVLQTAGRQIESTVNRPNNVTHLTKASSEKERFIFNIEIASDTLSDETRIVLNENASEEYELERDASKFMSMNEFVPQIYSIDKDGNRLAINERPTTNSDIALGVYIPNSNVNYSISAKRIDGEAYLYDAEMKITHNFADGDYNFSAEQGTDNKRFSIILKGNVQSSIDSVDGDDMIKVNAIENGIEIFGVSDKTVKVVTLEGITLYSAKSSESIINIPLASGIYIVSVENQSYKVIVK